MYQKMTNTCGNQKRESDSMKLELKSIVRGHVSARNETDILWKRSKCS